MKDVKIIEILKDWATALDNKNIIPRKKFLKKYNLKLEEINIINELIDKGLHLFFAVSQQSKKVLLV